MRLIDADGLMMLLERELDMNGITDWGKGYMDAVHDAMEHVKFMPTIATKMVEDVEDAKIRASRKAGINAPQLLNYLEDYGCLGVYNLGMKHMYEYLKGDNNETL